MFYLPLHMLWRAVRVSVMAAWYLVVGLALVAAVVAAPYVLAMAMNWLEAHQ